MHRKLKQHKELHKFYQTLWNWIIRGCPYHEVFKTNRALCSTLSTWLLYKTELDLYVRERIVLDHTSVLYDYFSNEMLPFNRNITHFSRERANHTIYKNKLRLAWIYKQSR